MLIALRSLYERTPVGASRAVSWEIHPAPVGKSLPASWRIANAIGSSRSFSWRLLNAVGASRTITWRIAAAIGSSRNLSWRLLQPIGASQALSWRLIQAIGVSRFASWRLNFVPAQAGIVGGGGPIRAAEPPEAPAQAVPVTAELSMTWRIRTVTASPPCRLSWRLKGRVVARRRTAWRLRQTVFSPRSVDWGLRTVREARLDIEIGHELRIRGTTNYRMALADLDPDLELVA